MDEHRGANSLSWAGLGMAVFGTVTQEQIVTILSLGLTVLVHFLPPRTSVVTRLRIELEYWKGRAYALDGRVDQLAAEIKELKSAQLPVAITPPFLPAEASTEYGTQESTE